MIGIGMERPAVIAFVVVLIASACVFNPAVDAAQTTQSVALANQLDRWNLPTRSMAVGGAYAADARGIQGGLTNPASLSRLQTNQFSVEHQRWRKNWDLFNVGMAVPLYGGHSLAGHATWLDFGELEPESDTELFRPQGNEFKGGLSYSYRFSENSALGITGGFMASKIGFRNRQYGTYANLGYIQRLTDDLWLGATLKNMAGEVRVEDGPDKLPRQGRLGLSWSFLQDRISVTADAVYHDPEIDGDTEGTSAGPAGGARLLLFDHYRLSAGYHGYYADFDGFTGGLEITYPNVEAHLSFMDTGQDDLIRVGGNMRF